MEVLESKRISNDRRLSLGERFQPQRVVVAVDATTEINLTALRYALENFVRPADSLSLLGILHPCFCSGAAGYEQKGAPKVVDEDVKNMTQEAIWKKHAEFQKSLADKEIYQLVVLKKVIFDIKVATGPDRKLVMAKEAIDLRASWVILDQDLGEDKAYLMEQINCNVVLMTSTYEAAIIRLEVPHEENPNVLEWKKRWTSAIGTARALRHLHEDCGVGCIVHRDGRDIPDTYEVVPVDGVFAHATATQPSCDYKESKCVGMRGYLAPEYAESSCITDKSDVYSFGVVLLQLVTGRKSIDHTRVDGEKGLVEWVRPLLQDGKNPVKDIVDPRLRNFCDLDQATRMVDVAARCISMDPSQRPTMTEVLGILEFNKHVITSISIGAPTNDLSDILRDPSTKCLLQTSLITFQTNVISLQERPDGEQFKGKQVAPVAPTGTARRTQSGPASDVKKVSESSETSKGPSTLEKTSRRSTGKSSQNRSMLENLRRTMRSKLKVGSGLSYKEMLT